MNGRMETDWHDVAEHFLRDHKNERISKMKAKKGREKEIDRRI